MEVTEAIKEEGYLHQGMKDLLVSLPSSVDTKEAKEKVDAFFDEVSLCGHALWMLREQEKTKAVPSVCPLSSCYEEFYTLIESLFVKLMPPQSSFLETMERHYANVRKQHAGWQKQHPANDTNETKG